MNRFAPAKQAPDESHVRQARPEPAATPSLNPVAPPTRAVDRAFDELPQLTLPFERLEHRSVSAPQLIAAERVFVNRSLQTSEIEWFGFDMDYTLALYNQDEMDSLSVQVTVDDMIRKGYPRSLRDLRFDTRFPIRGLLVDKREGNVLKMDRFKGIYKGYHGTRRLSKREIEQLYTHKRVRPGTSRYHWIDTLFGLSEVTAYAAIIDALEDRATQGIDYARVFEDVRDSIDGAHRDGRVHGAITADPARFLHRDPHLPETLHKLRSAGKKLFLLTNSPWGYTQQVMNHVFSGPEGQCHGQYPSWQHYFDIVIVRACKPGWFQHDQPFYEFVGGNARPMERGFERGRVYQGGNLQELERHLGVPGSKVLYVGDHIYGDILKSKKESAWHTALVVQELDTELHAHAANRRDVAEQREIEETRERLEDTLRYYQRRFTDLSRSNGSSAGSADKALVAATLDRIRSDVAALNRTHAQLAQRVDQRFHPYWGSLLKENVEMSSFGAQVRAYADVYMRSVSCLRHYSPRHHFRSARERMPHET